MTGQLASHCFTVQANKVTVKGYYQNFRIIKVEMRFSDMQNMNYLKNKYKYVRSSHILLGTA